MNEPQTDAEVEQVRVRIKSGRPYGTPPWEQHAAQRLGIDLHTPAPAAARRRRDIDSSRPYSLSGEGTVTAELFFA